MVMVLATAQKNPAIAAHMGEAIGIGFAAIAVLIVLYWIVRNKGDRNPLSIVIGADGLPSTSKTQFLLWTIVVIFSYVAIVTERMWGGNYNAIAAFPANVLIALGFSAVTAVTAKAITVSYLSSGQITKPPSTNGQASSQQTKGAQGVGAIFQDDSGYVDLTKVQIMAWTFIAISIFLARVFNQLSLGDVGGLPDIDPSLMVLTGLSAGTYLGKKLVTTATPTITAIAPATAKPGQAIVLSGTNFGSAQGNSLVLIDGAPMLSPITAWQDNQISFNLPATRPDQTAWSAPVQHVAVSVIVGGQSSANSVPLTVTPA